VKLFGAQIGRPSRRIAKRFAAVDFDGRRLRVALAEQAPGGTRIREAAGVTIGAGEGADEPEALGALLATTLKDMGFRGKGVAMSVPRSEAVLKPLSLPAGTPPGEIPSMVHYQAARELPFPVEDAVFDYAVQAPPAGEGDEAPREMKVLVAAIRLSVVDRYRRIAEAAGVELLCLGLRPDANMCCVEAGALRGEWNNVALVHLCAGETEIDLISRGMLVFSRSAVADAGAGKVASPGDDEKALGAVVSEVSRSLQSYLAVERGARIDGVLVAGETGLETHVTEALPGRLHVPCQTLRTEQLFREKQSKPVSSAFISAIGMAVGYSSGRGLSFDFLDPKKPEVKRDSSKAKAAAVVAAALVLVVGVVVARAVVLGGVQSDVLALNDQKLNLDAKDKAARKQADRALAMQAWEKEGHDWLDHWAVTSCLLPSAEDVYIGKITTRDDGQIDVDVQAKTRDAITHLTDKLKEAGYTYKPAKITNREDPYRYGYDWFTTVTIAYEGDKPVDLAKLSPAARPDDDCTPEQFLESLAPRRPAPARVTRPPYTNTNRRPRR
jgi:Tfp pilus assembly PilM family ATPase